MVPVREDIHISGKKLKEKVVVHNSGECDRSIVLCVHRIKDFVRRTRIVKSPYCVSILNTLHII